MITLTPKMIEFIYYVQRSTDSNLKWVRKARAPHFHLYNIEQVDAYKFKGENIKVTDGTIFYVTDLPFFAASNHDPMWVKAFGDCVKENLLPPMIMFRQHVGSDRLIPIPWEELFVVKNYNYTYIIIDGVYNDIQNMGAIVSPRRTLYSNQFKHEPELGMIFNKQGQLLCEDMLSSTNKVHQGYQIFADDIIVYKLRSFQAGEKGFIIEREEQKEKIFMDELIVTYDNYIILDPSVYMTYLEANAFRFNDGIDPTRLKIGVMYYESGNLSLDKIRRRLTPEEMKNNALEDINKNSTPAYENMKPPLNLDDDPTLIDKWYAIMAWDKDLYKEVTGEEPPVDDGVLVDPTKTLIFTGEEIKELTVDNEAIIENNRWKDDYFVNSDVEINGFCRAMVFQNGKLVNSLVTNTASAISFATTGLEIQDDDKFEVILMAYNEEGQEGIYSSIKLKDFEKSEQDLSTDFGLHVHNMLTYEAVAKEDGEFDFTNIDRTLMQYKIQCKNEPFTDATGDGLFKTKINALDDYYKNKILDVRFVARNRFAFQQIVIDTDDEVIEFELSEQFKFCQELTHYFITINGNRIDYKYLKLTHPKHNNAFYELKLFCQIPTHKGDVVNIFYLPFEMVEIAQKDIMESRCVTVPGMPAYYNSDIYWVFVNGKKILADYIEMPSDDTFAITDPDISNKNFTVLFIRSYINGTTETYFTPASDAYTGMTDVEIANTCGLSGLDEDIASIYDDCYDRESILKYIISKYYSISNDITYMTYEEVYREDENEMLAALSTRKDAFDNSYSVYKVGSYDSPNDENDLPSQTVPLS